MPDNVWRGVTERNTMTGIYYGCTKVACPPAPRNDIGDDGGVCGRELTSIMKGNEEWQ